MKIDYRLVLASLLVVVVSVFCLAPGSAAAAGVAPDDVLTVIGVSDGTTVTLYWPISISSSVAGYKVYVSPDGSSWDGGTDVGNVTSYAVTGLTLGEDYWFGVTAYDSIPFESTLYGTTVSGLVVGSAIGSALPLVIEGGTTVTAYRMISFPVAPSGDLLHELEMTLGSYDPASWRLFRWDPIAGGYREGSDAECHRPWRSAWLISAHPVTLAVEGQAISSSDDCTIVLHPGWNQIANPFVDAVDLSVVKVYDSSGELIDVLDSGNSYTTQGVWKYCSDPACPYYGGYESDTILAAFDEGVALHSGYWIQNKMSYDLFLFVPNPIVAKPGGESSAKPDLSGEDQPPAPPGGFGGGSGGGGGCFLSAAGL